METGFFESQFALLMRHCKEKYCTTNTTSHQNPKRKKGTGVMKNSLVECGYCIGNLKPRFYFTSL